MADVTIRPKPNGPYLVEGPVDIYDTAGILTSGGSIANLTAIVAAREADCPRHAHGEGRCAETAGDERIGAQIFERLDGRRMATLQDHTIVMHPGPINRGVELDDAAADADG